MSAKRVMVSAYLVVVVAVVAACVPSDPGTPGWNRLTPAGPGKYSPRLISADGNTVIVSREAEWFAITVQPRSVRPLALGIGVVPRAISEDGRFLLVDRFRFLTPDNLFDFEVTVTRRDLLSGTDEEVFVASRYLEVAAMSQDGHTVIRQAQCSEVPCDSKLLVWQQGRGSRVVDLPVDGFPERRFVTADGSKAVALNRVASDPADRVRVTTLDLTTDVSSVAVMALPAPAVIGLPAPVTWMSPDATEFRVLDDARQFSVRVGADPVELPACRPGPGGTSYSPNGRFCAGIGGDDNGLSLVVGDLETGERRLIANRPIVLNEIWIDWIGPTDTGNVAFTFGFWRDADLPVYLDR